jgi:hypothetical protein
LIFFDQFKKQNNGYATIMNLINVISKKSYSYPMKRKAQNEINRWFNLFYKEVNKKIDNITSDNEANFKNAIKQHNHITHWTVKVDDKAKTGVIERFNRIIRDKINTYMKLHKIKTWYQVLPKLIQNYNTSEHSTNHMASNDFKSENGAQIRI